MRWKHMCKKSKKRVQKERLLAARDKRYPHATSTMITNADTSAVSTAERVVAPARDKRCPHARSTLVTDADASAMSSVRHHIYTNMVIS